MSESRNDTTVRATRDRDCPVGSLASRALSVVASRTQRTNGIRHEDQVDRLLSAVSGLESRAAEGVVDKMIKGGVPPVLISDLYVPEVARKLGEAWCSDQTSFAEVTIGVSRLQTVLRRLGPEWRPDHPDPAAAETVLVVVNADMYHTLGAILISGQLRRRGLAVVLSIGEGPLALAQTLKLGGHRAVLISSALGEPLESLRKTVNVIRTVQPARQPVVLGGSIVDTDADLLTLTGVDHVTNDLDEVIRLCGLTITSPIDARSANEV